MIETETKTAIEIETETETAPLRTESGHSAAAGERTPADERTPKPAGPAGLPGRGTRLLAGAPGVLLPRDDRTERRMVLVQWLIMPFVLIGCLLPLPRSQEHLHILAAVAIMAMHPLWYAILGRLRATRRAWQGAWNDALLTAADITVATLVYYATAARPGYAQVLLYCAVALAATRYTARRAFGITSLVAFLLLFAALLPLHVAPFTLTSEIVGLYALTSLIGMVSQAEKAVSLAAVENACLARTVMQRNRELGTLNRLGRALNAETVPPHILRLGLEGMVEALELSGARAYLSEHEDLVLTAQVGPEGVQRTLIDSRRRREAERALAAGHTVVKGWYDLSGDAEHLAPGPLSISIPLTVHGRVGAVVQVDLAPRSTAMTEAMLETLEIFCGELAVALENASLRVEAHRTAILQEKNRIAQELHDTVLQMLFSVGLRLQWSLDQLQTQTGGSEEIRDALAEARHLSARAGGELRSAIFTLGSDIAEIGLVPAVEQLVSEQATRADWSANVMTSGEVVEPPVLVQNAAHRVVREALMNAYKHAGASEVVVSLRFASRVLTIVVQDNGVGIPSEALAGFRQMSDHFGLRTVAEQVEGLGGQFSVYNNDEQGTAVKAVLPMIEIDATAQAQEVYRASA